MLKTRNYILPSALLFPLLLLPAFLCPAKLGAQNIAAEVKNLIFRFRINESQIDYNLYNNRQVAGELQKLFEDGIKSSRIDSIHIQAFASPEGSKPYNALLANRRANEVKSWLTDKYPQTHNFPVTTSAHAADWKALTPLVESDTLTPCRDELLQILALDRPNERIGELVRIVNVGIPYRYVSENLLPILRNATLCIIYLRPLKNPGIPPRASIDQTKSLHPSMPAATRRAKEYLPLVREAAVALQPSARRTLFAFKTNLLFDAMLMPNIELEIPLGKRWSLNTEYIFPWWLINGDKYCLQVLSGGAEVRYWTGNRTGRSALTGHFLGLYAGGGKYDLQWRENGYQGEFFIAAGIGYGYARRIARNLNLEFNIGIGLLRTNYRHYRTEQNYEVLRWLENGNYTWFGPTKAKFSLVWLLNGKQKNK